MPLTTEDCRKWLTTTDEIQQLVRDRHGWEEDEAAILEMCDGDHDEVAFIKAVVKRAKNPKAWKRESKYLVGSQTDMDCRQYGLLSECEGGIIRIFNLDNSEISLVTLEKDGKLSLLDDFSD